jgi:hypothetical protein
MPSRTAVGSWFWGLAKPRLTFVGPTTAALISVAFLIGGIIVAALMPFGLQSENLSAPFLKDG